MMRNKTNNKLIKALTKEIFNETRRNIIVHINISFIDKTKDEIVFHLRERDDGTWCDEGVENSIWCYKRALIDFIKSIHRKEHHMYLDDYVYEHISILEYRIDNVIITL